MKKALLPLALFLALLLNSCMDAPPEVTTTAKPEETTTAAAAGSIVFQGERIDAPGAYENVPMEYTSILDTHYLENEITRRRDVLRCAGALTEAAEAEHDTLQSELDEREHAPYIYDDVETSGYALVDLDGDKQLELLLLCKFPDDYKPMQNPVVTAIFAIRDGRAQQIGEALYDEFGSDILVAADGALHQYIRDMTLLRLRSWRLEPGKTECTLLLDAFTDLALPQGKSAVPYWAKIENGKEIRIRETEFDALHDKLVDPENLLKPKFIPLHPSAKNPVEKPTEAPTEPPLPASVRLPKSYPDAPQAYRELLDNMYLYTQIQADAGAYHLTLDAYAVADINRDGTPELLTGSAAGLSDAMPNAIYTQKDGRPVLLAEYEYRSGCRIAADGIIYEHDSGSAANSIHASLRLEKNADKLTPLVEMYSNIARTADGIYYAKIIDGKQQYISEKEFAAFGEIISNPPTRMKLTVHPILDN